MAPRQYLRQLHKEVDEGYHTIEELIEEDHSQQEPGTEAYQVLLQIFEKIELMEDIVGPVDKEQIQRLNRFLQLLNKFHDGTLFQEEYEDKSTDEEEEQNPQDEKIDNIAQKCHQINLLIAQRFSISKFAQILGILRSTIYRKYIWGQADQIKYGKTIDDVELLTLVNSFHICRCRLAGAHWIWSRVRSKGWNESNSPCFTST